MDVVYAHHERFVEPVREDLSFVSRRAGFEFWGTYGGQIEVRDWRYPLLQQGIG
jgi:hypothetical protein